MTGLGSPAASTLVPDLAGVTATPDLTVTSSHSGNFHPGDVGDTYTIEVSNTSLAATSGTVTVVDTLPTGLTATGFGGTGWTVNLSTLTATNTNTLAGDSSYPALTLTVNVATNAPSSVTNTVTVSGGGSASPDTATDVTTIAQYSDMTIASAHTGNFKQGDTGDTYTITASNVGLGPTAGTVTVVDTLPTGLTATAFSGTGWTCNLSTLTATRSDVLAAESSYPALTLTVSVATNCLPA